MVLSIGLTAFYFALPFLLIFLVRRFQILDKIGSVILAYVVGLVTGNIIEPNDQLFTIQENLAGIAVLIALPLLLFNMQLLQLKTIAGQVVKCLIGGIIAVVLTVLAGHYFFAGQDQEVWKIGGMMVGVYTGGTPNLASLQAALGVTPEQFLLLNTYDVFFSSIYLLLLFSFGKFVFTKLLGKTDHISNNKTLDNHSQSFVFKEFIYPLSITIVIVSLAIGTSFLIFSSINMLYVILVITTLSLIASFNHKIQQNKNAYPGGMYFILVFSVVVASMADISKFSAALPVLLQYMAFVIFGSLVIHILWCYIFRIKGDVLMVTSVALICSPPFVPVIAAQVKSRGLILSGISVGLIGYAIGNYLGVTIAFVLKSL